MAGLNRTYSTAHRLMHPEIPNQAMTDNSKQTITMPPSPIAAHRLMHPETPGQAMTNCSLITVPPSPAAGPQLLPLEAPPSPNPLIDVTAASAQSPHHHNDVITHNTC